MLGTIQSVSPRLRTCVLCVAVDFYLNKLITNAQHSGVFSSWKMIPDRKAKFEADIDEIHLAFKEVRSDACV